MMGHLYQVKHGFAPAAEIYRGGSLEHQPHDLYLEEGVCRGGILHVLTVATPSPRRIAGEEIL